jgi:hypothetical protein
MEAGASRGVARSGATGRGLASGSDRALGLRELVTVGLGLPVGIPLVNIVRSAAQRELLLGIGATSVCDSSDPTFLAELTEAFAATGVTLAFDAMGGGSMPGQLLTCICPRFDAAAVLARAVRFSRRTASTKPSAVSGLMHADAASTAAVPASPLRSTSSAP